MAYDRKTQLIRERGNAVLNDPHRMAQIGTTGPGKHNPWHNARRSRQALAARRSVFAGGVEILLPYELPAAPSTALSPRKPASAAHLAKLRRGRRKFARELAAAVANGKAAQPRPRLTRHDRRRIDDVKRAGRARRKSLRRAARIERSA